MTTSVTRPAPSDVAAALDLLDGEPTDIACGIAVTRTGRPADQAPCLMLVHGVGSSRSTWAPMLAGLTEHYHLLVVDLPGHGRSEPLAANAGADCASLARHLARACQELGVAAPHVVGNSLGGWVGLELASDGAAASLVALAPAGLRLYPVAPGPLLQLNRVLARRTRTVSGVLLGLAPLRRVAFAGVSAAPSGVPVELARSAVTALTRCTAYEAMLDATRHRRFERARDVAVPTVIAFGDRDLVLPKPSQRRQMAPPGARWVQIPRCGHALMWDATEQALDLVHQTVDLATRTQTQTQTGAENEPRREDA
jgi:pimeloyl-ACP methyl ester carboxylesterase